MDVEIPLGTLICSCHFPAGDKNNGPSQMRGYKLQIHNFEDDMEFSE